MPHRTTPRSVTFTAFLIRCFLLLTLVGSAKGQDQDLIQFDVFLGFGGVVVQNAWFPITIEIKNDGPAFSGEIEVSDGGSAGGQVRFLKMEFPTGTLKRVVIPFYSNPWSHTSIDARLRNSRGKIVADRIGVTPQSQLRQNSRLVGSITRVGAGGPEIQKANDYDQSQRSTAVRLLPALLTDNPLLLQGLSCLYINTEKVAELTQAQTDAISRWLLGGGHLIIAVEEIQHVETSPWLKGLVPWRLSGITSVSEHGALQDWITGHWPIHTESQRDAGRQSQQGNRRPDFPFADLGPDAKFEKTSLRVAQSSATIADVFIRAGETPLVLSKSEGLGTITVMLFSPEREPFKSWKNAPVFWAKLAGVSGSEYVNPNSGYDGGWNSDAVFGAILDSRQVRTLPIGMLFLLLLGYLVIIGPVDYFWLKKIKRPMLTWITFPTYVAAFSILIYLIGYKLRSGNLEWSELHIVDLIQGNSGKVTIGRSYASLYSPSSRSYEFQGPSNPALFRTESGGNWRSRGSSQALEVRQRGESFDATGSVPVWTSLIFVTDWLPADIPPLVVSEVGSNARGATFKVRNGFQRPLSLSCIKGGTAFSLGEIKPGEELSFDTSSRSGADLFKIQDNLLRQMESAASARNMAFGRSDGRFIEDWVSAIQTLSAPTHKRFTSPPGLKVVDAGTEEDVLVVFAWVNDFAPLQRLPRFDVEGTKKKTMWRIIVRPQARQAVPGERVNEQSNPK